MYDVHNYNSKADHWNTLVLNKRQLVGANLVPLRVEVSESVSANKLIITDNTIYNLIEWIQFAIYVIL